MAKAHKNTCKEDRAASEPRVVGRATSSQSGAAGAKAAAPEASRAAHVAPADRQALLRNVYAPYLLHLMACALHGETPEEPPAVGGGGSSACGDSAACAAPAATVGSVANAAGNPAPNASTAPDAAPALDWRALHALARSNSVEGLVWASASKLAHLMPADLAAAWARDADTVLYRRVGFDVEREAIQAELDAAGISTLPLKGCAIAPLYPDPTMRAMCDNDILYGYVERGADGALAAHDVDACMRELAHIMEARGYEAESVGLWHHDGFQKAPFFNFEMHRRLASAQLDWAGYYDNPWSRAVPDPQNPNNPHRFAFRREDVYLFHVAHSFKHFDIAGCGVRCVADERVLLDGWGDGMDWGYIASELEKLDMVDFEARLRALATAALAPGTHADGRGLTEDQLDMAAFMLGAGTYGNVSTRVERGMEKADGKKAAYVWRRLYPGFKVVATNHPIVGKLPFLYPVSPAIRLASGLSRHSNMIWSELRALLRR